MQQSSNFDINKVTKELLSKDQKFIKQQLSFHPERYKATFKKDPEKLTLDELGELGGLVLEFLEAANLTTNIPEIFQSGEFYKIYLEIPKAIFSNAEAREKFLNILDWLIEENAFEFLGAELLEQLEGVIDFLRTLKLIPFFAKLSTNLSKLIGG